MMKGDARPSARERVASRGSEPRSPASKGRSTS
jgi:hypothetical protein